MPLLSGWPIKGEQKRFGKSNVCMYVCMSNKKRTEAGKSGKSNVCMYVCMSNKKRTEAGKKLQRKTRGKREKKRRKREKEE